MNTNQYSELEKVKLRIKALAAKTVDRGATESEAMSAMHVVGRLLQQYNLNMNELDVREAKCKTIYCPVGRNRRHPIDNTILALAAFVGAKCWFAKRSRNGNDSAYAFFGQEQDLELVEYLYNVIFRAIEAESQNFKKTEVYQDCQTHRKTAYVSFQRGMANRISNRLDEMRKENTKVYQNTGTALVVLKDQLVEEEFDKLGMKLRSAQHNRSYSNAKAWYAGKDAGDRVNLSRPLNDKGSFGGLLK